MAGLDHFSHEHELNLEEVGGKARDKFKCEICEEQISSSEEAYCCRTRDCKFFIHQICAKRPRDIKHPIHPQHALRLIPNRSDGINCNSCNEVCNGFNYHCEPCDFDLHIQCALPQQTRNHEHIHHHPLTFQTRLATFTCNFCRLKDEDQAYQCYKCPFIIHKKCASMPLTNLLNFHPHPLTLRQGIPEDQQIYDYGCAVCEFIPWNSDWIYSCSPCRYFVHIACIKVITDQIQVYYSLRDAEDYLEDSFFKFIFNDDLLHLPADNIAVDLIQRFLVEKNRLIDIQPQIDDFGHEQHSLILITEQMVNHDEYFEEEDEEILCDGCIEPITAPYYCCMECNYYLHVPCAHLPPTLQHLTHSHELTLYKKNKFHGQFHCNHCDKYTNGFAYGCDDCEFYMDIKCAALPTVIIHEVHEHPLILEKASEGEICNACNASGEEGDLIFKCKQFDDYLLDYNCAMLPQKFRHRWDRNHPISLRFPPHYEHPDHIMCDMCEEIIYPQEWLYSCFKCKVSFHQNCPPRLSKDPNIKYGGEVQISKHSSHPLKYLRQPTLKTSCDACGDEIRGIDDVFECETCYACICYDCVSDEDSASDAGSDEDAVSDEDSGSDEDSVSDGNQTIDEQGESVIYEKA